MKTIVLDIDRTIVDSVLTYKVKDEWKDKFEWFIYDEYTVFLRPNVREFITYLYDNKYNVGLFTAGSDDYARKIVKELFKDRELYFVFSNKEYYESFDMFGKLKCMEYVVYRNPELKVDECLLIDDSSRIKRILGDRCYNIKKFFVCYDNVPTFNTSSIDDKELLVFIEWLQK